MQNEEEIRKIIKQLFEERTKETPMLLRNANEDKENLAIPTLRIAKCVFGKNATTKQINPLLHRMEKEGLLKKITKENGADPRWKWIAFEK